ncbi:MAG: hydantoinase/oxoprolinase family protein [Syntrophomonadaceae bacterium]|nr:hydantoinase/oxoprolinase family protein [Syntrophomonadaceae bacterium]
MYLIGIDVGGTFTDGIIMKSGNITASAKNATNNSDISSSILTTLDNLLAYVSDKKLIERVVISTTTVTNLIATKGAEPAALILLPGYGLPNSFYELGENCYFIKGSIDFRGNITEELSVSEIKSVIENIQVQNIKRIGVIGKFSNRNNEHELYIEKLIRETYPEALVLISSQVSNQLNFKRRIATTYYTALTYFEWQNFIEQINKALIARDISAEVHILKADGGTIALEASRNYPCQTIYSGPAASTMGGVALTKDSKNSVVLDIGGTTTDISLVIEGEPLYASKGAIIEDNYTHVEAFSLTTLPIGGDSKIGLLNNEITLDSRQDFAACFGGKYPTITDAFNLLYDLKIGDYQKSEEILRQLAIKENLDPKKLAETAINMVMESLENAIKEMFTRWEMEPLYKVWEVVNSRKFVLHRIIGIGAAANAIIPVLASRLGVNHFLSQYSPVANALGTAVARPTININLHIDTGENFYSVYPTGYLGQIKNSRNFSLEDAKSLARNHLAELVKEHNMEGYEEDAVFYLTEQFNVIRGYSTSGKIFDVGLQVKPGFIPEFTGVK